MKRLAFAALAALAGCGTPQEQCINRNTRDLRVVDRLIVETEGNLQRGYALETVTRFEDYWGTCVERVAVGDQIVAQPQTCLRERSYTEERPGHRPQGRGAEAEGLKEKRPNARAHR